MTNIIGIGTDLVEIARIAKASTRQPRFIDKILHPDEKLLYNQLLGARQTAFLAKRFAAKEAISKALGLGMRLPMAWQAVAILPNLLGQPQVICFADLAKYLDERRQKLLISLSDERLYAQAFAILVSVA